MRFYRWFPNNRPRAVASCDNQAAIRIGGEQGRAATLLCLNGYHGPRSFQDGEPSIEPHPTSQPRTVGNMIALTPTRREG